MKDLIEIVKSLEGSGLLLKGVSETAKTETKEQKGGFLSVLLGTLGASLLGNILTRRRAIVKSVSKDTKWKRQGLEIVTAGYGNKKV